MKFLCIECDEAMKITDTRGPDEGSMTVVFGCPSCSKSIAMLTNAMETQMVRSLDVKIGGKKETTAPMGTLRGALTNQHNTPVAAESASAQPAAAAPEKSGGSKCPFTGAINEAIEKQEAPAVTWTDEAMERLDRIPVFVKPMVKKSIEQHAIEKGYKEIDTAIMDEIRSIIGM